jgi:uncharacterized Zn-binding protein involved in type VI secretion
MPPAARITDPQSCVMPKHSGGPIQTGESTVLIEGLPAARVGDSAQCTGIPTTTRIGTGSASVIIGGQKAARVGDTTCHGGVITTGAGTVIIGDSALGAMSAARKKGVPFTRG